MCYFSSFSSSTLEEILCIQTLFTPPFLKKVLLCFTQSKPLHYNMNISRNQNYQISKNKTKYKQAHLQLTL